MEQTLMILTLLIKLKGRRMEKLWTPMPQAL
jgi:hypothetical protein